MKWWDFTNVPFICLFVTACLALVVVLFLVISSIVINYKAKNYYIKLKNTKNSVRIFVINVEKNSVEFFNRSNIKAKTKTTLAKFYEHFHINDAEKIKNWFFNINLDASKAERYMEADANIKSDTSMFSLLKLLKFDDESGSIYIESHLLKYTTPVNASKKKLGKISYGLVKRSTINNLILQNKTFSGFTFVIRFFYLKQQVLFNDKIERYMLMILKNVLYPYASNPKTPRQIYNSNDNESLLLDLTMVSNESALKLAGNIERDLRKCIEVNGFSNNVDFAIGIVENQNFYQDVDLIIAKAQEACMAAQQSHESIVLYEKSNKQKASLNYADEINTLLLPGYLRYLFRPIVDTNQKTVTGYFQFVKGYETPFTSFLEMSKYAAKVGRNKELFGLVARHIVAKFMNESVNRDLNAFFYLSLVDLDSVEEIMVPLIKNRPVKIVLMFDEQEISENSANIEIIKNSLDKIKGLSLQIALLLRDKNLLLDASIYQQFDYFVIGAAMIGEIKKNNRIRLSIHSLIESLLKYNKPIIATDLEGWPSIELIIKSGISIISSEAISSSNDMLMPVEKKKLDKLVVMNDNFN